MKRLRGQARGFTIVETMMFLAISAGLLLVALTVMGGQNRKTQFSTTIREVEAKLQATMENVTNGLTNVREPVTCSVVSNRIIALNNSGGSGEIGQEGNCIFSGQAFIPTPNGNTLNIYTIASPRMRNSMQNDSLYGSKLYPSTVEQITLPQGYSIGGLYEDEMLATNITGSFAVVTTFAKYSSSNTLQSGITNTDIYYGLGDNTSTVDSKLQSGPFNKSDKGIIVCITDGTRIGIITVNTSGVRSEISTQGACA